MNIERREADYHFKLRGRIRGDYCFERFCKYGVFDADNHLLLSNEFKAGGDWTIKDHIPFSIDFLSNDKLIDDGTIVIQSTNPSVLSKNSGCFSLPVFLQDSLLNNQAVHFNYQYGISFYYPINFHANGDYWSYPIETTPLALGNEGIWMFFDNHTITKEKINELKEGDVVKTEPDDSATQMIYQKSSQNIANDLIEGYLIEENPGKNHYQPTYGLSYVIKLRDGTYVSLNLSSMYEETLQSWKDEFGQIISTTRYINGE